MIVFFEIWLLLGWIVFCATVYSFCLTGDSSLKDVIKFLVFCLVGWPYFVKKIVGK